MPDDPVTSPTGGDDLDSALQAALKQPIPDQESKYGMYSGPLGRVKARAAELGFGIINKMTGANIPLERMAREEKESLPYGPVDAVADAALFAPSHGVAKFDQSVLSLVDHTIGFGAIPDSWHTDVPEASVPETVAGGLVSGATQFAAAAVVTGPAVGAGFKAYKASRATGALANAAGQSWSIRTAAKVGDIAFATRMGKVLTSSAAADFLAWDENSGRVSDMARKLGGPFDNTVTRLLSTNEDDHWLLGRAKNVIEGGILGAFLGSVMRPTRDLPKGFLVRASKDPTEELLDAVREANVAAAAGDAEALTKAREKAQTAAKEVVSSSPAASTERARFREEAVSAGVNPEVVDTSLALHDVLAETWAAKAGRSIDDYYIGLKAQAALEAPIPPSARVRSVRDGLTPGLGPQMYESVDEAKAMNIADAYDAMKHAPDDPAVKASYDAFKAETLTQWKALQADGIEVVPWAGKGEPYKSSSEMVRDIQENGRIYFLRTVEDGNFGGAGGLDTSHPLLEKVGESLKDSAGKPYEMTYNDVFRVVHDVFGHAAEGVQFGARGEENAWIAHARMYGDVARRAMTSETRGQNSWVNYGPKVRRTDRTIPKKGDLDFLEAKDRPFAEQKAGLLPEWASELPKKDTLFQVEELLTGDAPKFGGPPAERLTAIAKFLDQHAKANPVFTKPLAKVTPSEFVAGIADHTRRELEAWDQIAADYKGFYDHDINVRANPALQEWVQSRHGRAATAAEVKLFHLVAGFASPSAEPSFDSRIGLRILDRFLKNGELHPFGDKPKTVWKTVNGKKVDTGVPAIGPDGKPYAAKMSLTYHDKGLSGAKTLIDKMGLDKAMEWLGSWHSFDEIATTLGLDPKAMKPSEYLSKETGGFGIFGVSGPKLGSYVLNRWGNFSTVTKDMWYARTMARLTGQKLVTKSGVLKEPWGLTKEGVKYRTLADRAWEQVAAERGVEPAIIQQQVWDLERRLYDRLGNRQSASGTISEGILRESQALSEPVGQNAAGGEGVASGGQAGPGEPSPAGIEEPVLAQSGVGGGELPKGRRRDAEGQGSLFGDQPNGPRGAISFNEDGTRVISILKSADASTLTHELLHDARRMLSNVDADIDSELRRIYGVEGVWTPNHEEALTRDWETYLAKGEAPKPALQAIFDKFKEWMVAVYRGIAGSPVEREMTPGAQTFFDKLLGREGMAPDVITQTLKDDIAQAAKRGLGVQDALAESVYLHINYGRLNIPDKVESVLKAIEPLTQKAIDGDVGAVQTLKEVRSLASELGEDAADVVEMLSRDKDAVKRLAPRMLAYRVLRNTIGLRLSDIAQKLDVDPANGFLKEELLKSGQDLFTVDRHFGSIQKEVARALGQQRIIAGAKGVDFAAQASNALKAVEGQSQAVQGGIEAASAADAALRAVLEGKSQEMTAKVLLRTLGAAKELGVAPRVMRLFNHAQEGWFRKAMEIHNEMWQAALLSGTKTFSVNFVSNLLNTVSMPLERFLGAAVTLNGDEIKNSARFFTQLLGTSMDVLRVWKTSEVRSNVVKALKTESPVLDPLVATRESNRKAISSSRTDGVGKIINTVGKIVRLPFRINGTADEFFKQVNYRAYLRTRGLAAAEQLGVPPAKLGEFLDGFTAKGYDSSGAASITEGGDFLFQDALEYARESTFSQDLLDGTLGKTVQGAVIKHPVLRLFLPFVRTPTNIFRKAVRYTPGLNLLQSEYRSRLTSQVPEIAARARGEMIVGGAVWTSAIALATGGGITGGGPANKAERDVLMSTGWRPYSFVSTNADGTKSYTSFLRFDPSAMILGLAADFTEAAGHLDDQTAGEIGTALVMALGRNLTNKTYMQGLKEFVTVLAPSDESTIERFLKARTSSYVPSLVGNIAAAEDEYMRDARTILDAVRRKIPGLSETLPPRRNVLGEAITPDSGFIPFVDTTGTGPAADVGRMVSPAAYSKGVDDNVKSELARLSYGFSMPAKKIQGLDLTLLKGANGQDAYDYFVEQHGKVKINGKTMHDALGALMKSDRYRKMPMPDDTSDHLNPRVRAVQDVISRYRDKARWQTLKQYPEIKRSLDQMKRQAASPGQKSPLLKRLAA